MKWFIPIAFALLAACSSGHESPVQPLPFSHAIHAGQQAIACVDCHAGAERGVAASLPAIRSCLSCHMRPQGNPPTGRDQIVRDRAAQPGPFRWVQVTRNPGHVYFSHRAHVTFGKMTCTECHGDVASWAEAPTTPNPKLRDMDTCMACHRKRWVSNSCTTCHR